MSDPVAVETRIRRSAWTHFPIWMLLAMGTVVAVNARLIYFAVTTFPGAASQDDFDTSNQYNRVLSAVDRQNALGWHVRADAGATAPALVLTDAQDQPLAGASIAAVARRPIGSQPDAPVSLGEMSPGRYQLRSSLPRGQWDLLLRISVHGQELRVTRRVLIR